MSFKKILGSIRKADIDYNLIQDNDRVCVGVSGGKDSLLLLVALNTYRKIAKKYDDKNFSVIGIHLEMGFPDMDFSKVREYMKDNNIEYVDYPTRLYDILKLHLKKDNTLDCALCSTLKKGAIVKASKEYNCTKVAFAHHADDAIETLFLNMIYGGRINTFDTAMHLSDTNTDFIRPLIYCFEDDIEYTAIKELNLPIVKSTCPNDGFTKRQDMKDLLNDIYRQFPSAKKNFLKSLHNTEHTKLWVKNTDWQNND